MTGRNDGGAGSVVGEIGKWADVYEKVLGREEKLKKELRKIESLLKEAEKTNIIDTEKMRRQYQRRQEELRDIQERRLRLEWLAVSKIERGEWDPRALAEYEFVRDLLLLNKIREEQIREVCQNCNECSTIRVKTATSDIPLEVVVKSRGIPYIPLYSLVEIREYKQNMEVREVTLGALTEEEKKKIEQKISEKLACSKNVLNCFLTEKRVPLNEEIVLKHRKYGCHRKLPKWLPITIMNTEIDSDPKAPDHFPEDITASLGEDGSYDHIYLSPKHGSEEFE
jgi:hypothetical protein